MKQVEKLWSEMAAKKAELASQEVQLSAVKELKKLADAAKDLQNDLERSEQDIKDAIDTLSRLGQQAGDELQYAEKIDNDIETVIREIITAAEAIGFDASIPEVTEAQDRQDSLRKVFNEVYALYKKI
jgi:septal ring factor EnvC (AmiA/AmiB activator)